jgi:putative FmdB family regulatory protein
MPTYEYRCVNGHTFEVVQRMADDPIETCEECGAPVERVFHAVAVHFKGSGFYTTDYAAKGKAGAAAGQDGEPGKKDGGDAGSSSDSGSDSSSKSGSGESGGGEKAKSGSGSSDD